MAQLSDEKKAIKDDTALDDREMSGWGSPINSENSSPRMACAPQDEDASRDQLGSASRSSTRLDFLDDDDDDPFIERRLCAPPAQTKEAVARGDEKIVQEKEPAPASPVQGDIRGLFDSSESDDGLFRTPSFSAGQAQTLPGSAYAAIPQDRASPTPPDPEEGPADRRSERPPSEHSGAESQGTVASAGAVAQKDSDTGGQEALGSAGGGSLETAGTPSGGPKHPRPDLAKTLLAMKENVLRYRPLVKAFNSRILVSKKTVSKRCVGGGLVEREQVVFCFSQIEVPRLEDIEIRDEKMNKIIALDKNTPVDEVEGCLGIEPMPVLEGDVLIDKQALNQLLACSGVIDPRRVGELVARCSAQDPFRTELLRAKMGLDFDLSRAGRGSKDSRLQFDPGYLSYVARLNNPGVTRLFISSQSNFILYYVVFYRLGLVTVGDFAARFYNNLHYLSVLSKVNKSENLSVFEPARQPAENRGWSLKSVLDFGISKILNVESREGGVHDEQPYKKLVGAVDAMPEPVMSSSVPRPGGGAGCLPEAVGAAGHRAIADGSDAVSLSGEVKLNVSREAGVDIESLFGDDDEIDMFDDKSGIVEQINRLSIRSQPEGGRAADAPVPEEGLEGGRASAKTSPERPPIYQNDRGASSSSSLEKNETQGIYKKKFSKSFADIFSLGGQGEDSANLDVSTYVDDINENDKPMLVRNFEEESRSSIFNVFGIFKKKDRAAAKESAGSQRPRPLRSAMKIPEKERTIVRSIYANKKSYSLEIPGAGGRSAGKQAIHPDRSPAAASQGLGRDTVGRNEK